MDKLRSSKEYIDLEIYNEHYFSWDSLYCKGVTQEQYNMLANIKLNQGLGGNIDFARQQTKTQHLEYLSLKRNLLLYCLCKKLISASKGGPHLKNLDIAITKIKQQIKNNINVGYIAIPCKYPCPFYLCRECPE